jgi:predicted RNase H-like nuclease (RuvC/YqgF family)
LDKYEGSNIYLEEFVVEIPLENNIKKKGKKIKKLEHEVIELSTLNMCIERENEQLKGRSKKLQEEIEKLQLENNNINRNINKMIQTREKSSKEKEWQVGKEKFRPQHIDQGSRALLVVEEGRFQF